MNWDSKNQVIVKRADQPYRGYPNWSLVDCHCCNGIQWGGDYPQECDDCNGGWLARHNRSGRLALYPGGPFVGRV